MSGHLRRQPGLLLASRLGPGLSPAVTVLKLTASRPRQGHPQGWQNAGPGQWLVRPENAHWHLCLVPVVNYCCLKKKKKNLNKTFQSISSGLTSAFLSANIN